MPLLGIVLMAQLAAGARPAPPVLSFPEPGLDDAAAYAGYQTRFYRDAVGNTVQIYLDGKSGRVVHLLANAEDESIAFTVRGARGAAPPLQWASTGTRHGDALVWQHNRSRVLQHSLIANSAHVYVGLFLLGSMRVERDFQYADLHRGPMGHIPSTLSSAEAGRFVAALRRLDRAEQRRDLALLGVPDLATLEQRLRAALTIERHDTAWVARVTQPAVDGHDTTSLEIQVDPRRVEIAQTGDSLSLRARSGGVVPIMIRVSTTARALTPLTRREIFAPDFLTFLAAARADSATPAALLRGRWLEREVRGVELLASRDKLMAGLPAYATYFGRDMLVSALMMRPIWRTDMSELVVASVLRKLSPGGDVSHEEALGGQAVREAVAEYAMLIDRSVGAEQAGRHGDAARLLDSARGVLRDHRRTRENYHMIDNAFQLPVLAGRWLADPAVAAARKRAFLMDSADGGGTRLAKLLRELALVARLTAPYVAGATAGNLVSFAPGDSGRWISASWRDSGVGYAGGRYAMDVNAIWAPHALQSIARILATLDALGISRDAVERALPAGQAEALRGYVHSPAALRRAIDTWSGVWRLFVVRLSPRDVQTAVATRLAAMADSERTVWRRTITATHADADSLIFLALSLDANGRPIGVVNSDPATRLFLGDEEPSTAPGTDGIRLASQPIDQTAGALRDARVFVRPYPVGLFIDGVGPVVANDTYAPPRVWTAFERDPYHGPRVVWGREVNLFLLGAASRIGEAGGDPALASYVRELRADMMRVYEAAQTSGFHSELWSYTVTGGRVAPVRYGTGSDVQLWSTTDLAVQFALWRLADGPSGRPQR